MKLVLSLGGSVVRADRIKEYAAAIEEVAREHELFIVVGGGKLARELIGIARSLNANEALCDCIGIEATRINAMLLAAALKNAPKIVPRDLEEAERLSKIYDIVVMGGTFPGHTTDATAALLAEYVSADLLMIATSVDGVYTADPRLQKDAKKLDRLTPQQLVEIVSRSVMKAGASVVVDLLAAKIIERSGIKTVIFLGEPENIVRVARGEEIGTTVEAP